jgi:parallel beta-helix repeat protein
MVVNCAIRYNTANEGNSLGGGIFCWDGSSPKVVNCTVVGNVAQYGGGIYCGLGSFPTVAKSVIDRNTAHQNGGGVSCVNGSDATFSNCTISDNEARSILSAGGGVFSQNSHPTLFSCMISSNSADYGAGVNCRYRSNARVTLINCAIVDHPHGAGVYCGEGSISTLTNCVVWNNRPGQFIRSGASPIVTYSCVQGGIDGLVTSTSIRCSLTRRTETTDSPPHHHALTRETTMQP